MCVFNSWKKYHKSTFSHFKNGPTLHLQKNSTVHIGFAVTLVDKKVLRKRTCIVYYYILRSSKILLFSSRFWGRSARGDFPKNLSILINSNTFSLYFFINQCDGKSSPSYSFRKNMPIHSIDAIDVIDFFIHFKTVMVLAFTQLA